MVSENNVDDSLKKISEIEISSIEDTLLDCAKSISLKKRSNEETELKTLHQLLLQKFNIANISEMTLKDYEIDFSDWIFEILSKYM